MENPYTDSLLKKSFSEEEWQYLAHHKAFQDLLKKHFGNVDEFEHLIQSGRILIRQKKELGLE
jgi:hypothetical protein